MEKLIVISGILFFLADIFAVASLANPEWVISDDSSNFRIGLTSQCLTIFGRDPVCLATNLSPEWEATLVFIILGILCLTITCVLLAVSLKKSSVLDYARWVAFCAMIFFCIAALIFPVGFYMDEIGGEPYKLPTTVKVGSSYVMFILAIFLTIISELFAGKICLPRL
jgi:small-conductance mechanosensitive channel